jgi:hypothetical protein
MSEIARFPSPLSGEGHGGGKEEDRVILPPSPSLPRTGGEWARYFRRGPWENVAVGLIGIGIVMLMQPYWMALFTWSFVTILAGTAMFVIVSHFPE